MPVYAQNILTLLHLLVDLESVQPSPADVEAALGADGEAWVFFGPHQTKLKAKFETGSPRSTLIPISRSGKNALDFHLVFYLGYLASRHMRSRFVVVAKDTGYDAAVSHAKTLNFSVERKASLTSVVMAPARSAPASSQLPKVKPQPLKAVPSPHVASANPPIGATKKPKKQEATNGAILAAPTVKRPTPNRPLIAAYSSVLKDLQTGNRPKTMNSLRHHIQTKFGPTPAPEKVDRVISKLEVMDIITLREQKLVYNKPPSTATESQSP